MADQLTEKIIAAAIEVHKTLGPELLETIYEEALCHEFRLANINFQRQIAVNVNYKGHVIQGQRLDLLVEEVVVIEIKSLRTLPEIAISQLLSYLKATNLKRGLLINFGEKQLTSGIKRISL